MDERFARHQVIVFDVGHVLVHFDPGEISEGFGLSAQLYRGAFESGLWLHTDSMQDYLKVVDLLDHFPDMERPFSGSLLLPELKQAGKKLYYLSNYGVPMFERTMERFPFFQLFDGGVVSGHEHIIKPMPRIYEILCERYGFQPEEALFVDDNADNIAAARKLGFDVWQFEGTPLPRQDI